MFIKNLVVLLAALPAIVVSSPVNLKEGLPGYGNGGRYGFKKCVDKGVKSGKISCINFDSIETNSTTAVGTVPKDYTGLIFSPQWSAFNVTAGEKLGVLPDSNKHSAVSTPNALIGSRYNPNDKKDNSPASFSVNEGTFDLFGFYLQPMESPPPGVSVYITGYPADEEKKPFEFTMSFLSSSLEPIYFDSYEMSGPDPWDGLKNVTIWAGYGGDEIDWEFFIDDLWVRWGNETESALNVHHSQELK